MHPSTRPEPVKDTPRLSARERLLSAADELFYENGVHSVGIDRIIEHAGVAKASLYDVFGSKDALVTAYLARRQDARRARIERAIEKQKEPHARLLAAFDAMTETLRDPAYRGCAFARASAESPSASVKAVSCDARTWTRDVLTTLSREAGLSAPEALARQLVLLYDGAAATTLLDGDTQAAKVARAAAAHLIDAARAPRNRTSARTR